MKSLVTLSMIPAVLYDPAVPDGPGSAGASEPQPEPQPVAPVVAPSSIGVTAPIPAAPFAVDKLKALAKSLSASVAALASKLDNTGHSAIAELDQLNKEVAAFNDHINQATKTASYVPPALPLTPLPVEPGKQPTPENKVEDRTQVNPGQGATLAPSK